MCHLAAHTRRPQAAWGASTLLPPPPCWTPTAGHAHGGGPNPPLAMPVGLPHTGARDLYQGTISGLQSANQPYTLVPVVGCVPAHVPPSLPDGAHRSSQHRGRAGHRVPRAEVTSCPQHQGHALAPPRPTTARPSDHRHQPRYSGSRGAATSTACSGKARCDHGLGRVFPTSRSSRSPQPTAASHRSGHPPPRSGGGFRGVAHRWSLPQSDTHQTLRDTAPPLPLPSSSVPASAV